MTSHQPAQPLATSAQTPKLGLLVALSAARFTKLLLSRSLRQRRDHLAIPYAIEQGGNYLAFRETVSDDRTREPNVVLVVGFRLRGLRRQPVLHRIFQRVCLLTTPFWSGFRGFRVKLWMVDPDSKNYLGIYEWSGLANAKTYASSLVRILHPISTAGSVWYQIYPDQNLEPFLEARSVERRESQHAAAIVQ
jgi:hypothetical protein